LAILLAAADPQEELQLKHLFFVAQELKKEVTHFISNQFQEIN